MQNSLTVTLVQLITGVLLGMSVVSLLILVPSMIFRKGRPEKPEIRWAGNVCLVLGCLASIGMLDMYRRNGGDSGLFALVTVALAVLYWLCLRSWSNRPLVPIKGRAMHTHRNRLGVMPPSLSGRGSGGMAGKG